MSWSGSRGWRPALGALVMVAASGAAGACGSNAEEVESARTAVTTAVPTASWGRPNGEAEAVAACEASDEFFGYVAKHRRDPSEAETADMLERMVDHAGRAAKESSEWNRLQRAMSDYRAYSEVDEFSSEEDIGRADDALRVIRQECEKATA